MARIIIHMNNDEWEALVEWAQKEYRDPRAQAALFIRNALLQERLLEDKHKTESIQGEMKNEETRKSE